MGRLNLEDIQPGMVIAADVLDRNGRILLKTGLEINDKHLKILKQWGITDADIKGVSREEVTAAAVQNLDQEALAKAEEHYTELFRLTDRSYPFVEELFRLSILRHVNQMQGGGAE
jgi:hypothetical protein